MLAILQQEGRAVQNYTLATLALAVLASASAQANVMTFGALPPGVSTMATYTENGITASGPGDFVNLPSGSLHLDSGGVPENNSSYGFTLASGAFNLTSFDVTSACSACDMGIGLVEGRGPLNNLLYSANFNVTATGTLSFVGWGGITTLVITAINSPDDHFSIDNLVINAVPEPATWALMIVGFGMVGGAMRRRVATAAA